jgi:hypothetical protein
MKHVSFAALVVGVIGLGLVSSAHAQLFPAAMS